MELVGAFRDPKIARSLAEHLRGRLVLDPREDSSHLPCSALVSVDTDHISDFLQAADVGAYLAYRREVKPRSSPQPNSNHQLPGKIALFPMVRRRDLDHEASDAHWRDVHAPIALRVHSAMTFYTQLSVVHRFHGPQWDGIAQCGFDSLDDLRLRFYSSPSGQKEVERDVVQFADPKRSPRRLICDEFLYSQ